MTFVTFWNYFQLFLCYLSLFSEKAPPKRGRPGKPKTKSENKPMETIL